MIGIQLIFLNALYFAELPVWIDVPPKNTDAVVNDTVELECVGRGNPSPTITWQKNDQNINFANNPRYFQKSSGSLQISRSQKSDSGKYTCIATNSIGSKRANASLRVLSKFNLNMYFMIATIVEQFCSNLSVLTIQ